MPVVIPGVMHVFLPGCWSLKKIPVQSFRRSRFYRNRDFTSCTGIKSLGQISFAYDAFMDLIDDLDTVKGGPLLVAHLYHFVVFFLVFHQQFPLSGIVATGLFYKYMFTTLYRKPSSRGMPMIGCSVDDSIYFWIFYDFEQAVFQLRLIVYMFFETFCRLFSLGFHHITEIKQVYVTFLSSNWSIKGPQPTAQSCNSDVQTVIGSHNPTVAFGRKAHSPQCRKPCRGQDGFFDKNPSCFIHFFHFDFLRFFSVS